MAFWDVGVAESLCFRYDIFARYDGAFETGELFPGAIGTALVVRLRAMLGLPSAFPATWPVAVMSFLPQPAPCGPRRRLPHRAPSCQPV